MRGVSLQSSMVHNLASVGVDPVQVSSSPAVMLSTAGNMMRSVSPAVVVRRGPSVRRRSSTTSVVSSLPSMVRTASPRMRRRSSTSTVGDDDLPPRLMTSVGGRVSSVGGRHLSSSMGGSPP